MQEKTKKDVAEDIIALKKNGCNKCGFAEYPESLEFNHLEERNKIANISNMILNPLYTAQNVIDEIAKCELLCSNCHRHYTRLHPNKGARKFLAPKVSKKIKNLTTLNILYFPNGMTPISIIVKDKNGEIKEIQIEKKKDEAELRHVYMAF